MGSGMGARKGTQLGWQAVRSFHICYYERDTGYLSAPSESRVFATAPRAVKWGGFTAS